MSPSGSAMLLCLVLPARRDALSALIVLTVSAVLASAAPVWAAPPGDPAPPAATAVTPAERAQSAADRPQPGRGAAAADGELVELRTATSRTYRLKNGRLQARLYPGPVNHRDDSGRWQKNDNRIMDDAAGGGRNAAGAYRLSLPKQLASRPVEVSAGGARVGFQLQGADAALQRDSDTATYPQALNGVDLEYRSQSDGVKETLVLHSAGVPTSYDFAVSLSKGLTLASAPDGGLVATDTASRRQLTFSAPSVTDSSGTSRGFSKAATRLSLSGPADAPTVRLSLDPAWLADPARVFPIRLDPSYDTVATASTYVNSGSTGTNYSAATVRRVGVDTAGESNNTLISYDVSSVPRDATVYNAVAFLDITGRDCNASGSTIQARALTRAWSAGTATWATYDGSHTWTTAGGDATVTDAVSKVVGSADSSLTLQPTALVRDWVTGLRPNNGLQLSSTSSTTGSSFALKPTIADAPLFVDYVNRTGDQPYWTYSSQQLTDRAQLKVNVSSGNLLLENSDTDLIGRTYNSRGTDYTSGALPTGWSQTPGNDELLDRSVDAVYRGPSGTAVPFFSKAGGGYASAAGSGADLADNGATLTDRKSGTVRTFDGNGRLVSITDRNGNTTTIPYTGQTAFFADGIVDAAGRRTDFGYTGPGGQLGSMTDVAGRNWSYGYDSNGTYLTNYTDPAGKITTYGYDSAGLLSQIVTPAGRKTLITYDGSGRAKTVMRVASSGGSTGPTTTYAYSATGGGNGSTTVTDPNGQSSTYAYDAAGRVTSATDALGRARSASYADNSVTSAVDAMTPAGTTSSVYDTDNRPTTATSPGGAVSALTYAEAAGPVTNRAKHYQPATGTSSDGNASSFTYDGPGNLTKAQDTTGGATGGAATSYTYNPPAPAAPTCGGKPGQQCTATDGRGKVTRYSYDTAGNLIGTANPAPLGGTSATYDALGRVTSSTDGKSQTTGYSYDALDRVVETRYSGTTTCTATQITAGTCIANTYDADGNLTGTQDQTGTTSFGYDQLGQEAFRSLPSTGTTSLSYDATGNVLTATDGSGTTTYTYDDANELTSLREPGGSCTTTPKDRCTTFGYNRNGVRTVTTYPTSPVTTMTLTPDTSGRVGNIRAVTGSTVQSDLSYTYSRMVGTTATDGVMTRSRTDNTASGSTGKTTTYGYDSLARLTSAVEKNTAGSSTASWSYGYDAAGNRTSATLSPAGTGGTTAFGYNDANQLISRGGSTTGFSYDANGNETSAVGVSARTGGTWNAKEQLTAVSVGGTTINANYSGDGNGLRLTAGATSYRNTALGITATTTGSTTATFIRDPEGTLIGMRIGGSTAYYLFDGLGSVIGLVNNAGSKVDNYSYDPYGQTRTVNESFPQPYRYTGGLLDPATGLYKLGIRYYDPTLGRFTQIDPTGLDVAYNYVSNSPVNYTDPDGTCGFCFAPALLVPGLGEAILATAAVIVVSVAVVAVVGVGIAYAQKGRQNIRQTGGGDEGTSTGKKARGEKRNSGGDGRGTQKKTPPQDKSKKPRNTY